MEPGRDLGNKLGLLLYGMTPSEAIEKGVCIKCKQPPTSSTEAGKAEYPLSGMCEPCFDEEFKELL